MSALPVQIKFKLVPSNCAFARRPNLRCDAPPFLPSGIAPKPSAIEIPSLRLKTCYHAKGYFGGSNETMANLHQTYSFSFTGASLLFHDFLRLANHVAEHQLDVSKQLPDPSLVMGRSNAVTSKREMHELLKRYRLLTPTQRALLTELDAIGQKHLALLGICKAYPFIRDFIVEVVREKFLSLDYHLTDGDYQSFYNRKLDSHPGLEEFTESTTKKAKQVTFRILEEAGMIDNTKDRIILPQFVNQRVFGAVAADNPALLKIFLMTDQDIKACTA